jgi:hypothetical protein
VSLPHLFTSTAPALVRAPQVTRAFDMPEPAKLEFIREIGFSHMRIAQGLNTQLQLLGCVARLCQLQQQGASAGHR